jgi:hypothetical protein
MAIAKAAALRGEMFEDTIDLVFSVASGRQQNLGGHEDFSVWASAGADFPTLY